MNSSSIVLAVLTAAAAASVLARDRRQLRITGQRSSTQVVPGALEVEVAVPRLIPALQ